MNLQNVKTEGVVYPEVFQKVLETNLGANLDIDELPSAIEEVRQGQLLSAKDTSGQVHVVKTAKLYADALVDAVTYQVEKGHFFKVGDIIATKEVDDCLAYAITAIDTTTNTTHDVITVGTSLGVVMTAADGVYLIQAAAEDTAGGAFTVKYPVDTIMKETQVIPTTDNPNINVSGVIQGSAYEGRLPFEITADQKSTLAGRIYFY